MKVRELFEAEKIYKVTLDFAYDTMMDLEIDTLYDGDDPAMNKRLEKIKAKRQSKTEMDIATEKANEYSNPFGVKAKVVNLHGPGGGWPEVEFSGPRESMEEFIKDYFHGDEDTAEEIMDEVFGED